MQIASTSENIITQTDQAKVKVLLTQAQGVEYYALPTHIIGSGSTALTLPVVMPTTLGIADLSLTTASGAQDATQTIATATTRLSTAQAQLGSQQDALQAQQTTTHTKALQLQSSDAALTNVNLPQMTQQMSQAQGLQQSGLHVLTDERTLQQQAAQILQSIV